MEKQNKVFVLYAKTGGYAKVYGVYKLVSGKHWTPVRKGIQLMEY
jgi:hypothetical protein